MLWIAFRLYLWNIDFSYDGFIPFTVIVVNCFQIVSLKYWFQQNGLDTGADVCCELLSDCIFEILISAKRIRYRRGCLLWIAFRLYLWNIDFSRPHNKWHVINVLSSLFQKKNQINSKPLLQRGSGFFVSKQLKLLRCIWFSGFGCWFKKLHHAKLFIGEGKHNNLSFRWQETFYPSLMYFSIFAAVAVAHINGILQHGKPILH